MRAFFYVLIFFFLSSEIFGQISNANLNGKVVDEEGEDVVAAAVLVLDLDAGLNRAATTNPKGIYHFVGLPPGRYEVKVQHVAFHDQKKQIDLVLGQTANLDFKLVPESIELGAVEVISQAPKFELNKSDVSSTIKEDQIETLPLDSRSILNLGAITPGVKSYGGSYPSSGAVSSYNFINLYVNGSEWKSQFNGNIVGLGQTASPIPQDAVQEFKVIHNAYDAEYTRGGSILISAVTKRGTNQLRGNAFFTLENKDLTNRGPFQTEIPDYSRRQGGISLSGPFIPDKLFYAITYEVNDAVNILTVNPGKPAYNPGIWSSYAGDFESPRTTHLVATKMTYQKDTKNLFNLSWNYRNTSSKFYFGGTTAYQAGLFGQYSVNDVMLNHTHIFSNNMTNELTLQYLNWRHDEPTISSGPAFIYPSITLGRATFPIKLKEDHYTILNKLTYSFKSHILKAGFKVTSLNAEPWFPYYKDGEFLFRTDTSSVPYQGTIGIGLTDPSSNNDANGTSHGWALGAFIQDGWRVTDQLRLDLGLRWDADINMLNNDYTVSWADDPIINNNIDDKYINRGNRKNQYTDFSPRINFNYDLFDNGLTILRGGYGRFFDRTVGYIGYFEFLYSNWGIYTIQNPGTTNPEDLRQQVLSGQGSANPSLYMLSNDMETPKIDQWSIGIGHQFTNNFAVGLDYVNKHYTNIFKAYNANYYQPSSGSRILTNEYSDIWLYDSFGEAWWYGFLTSISYRNPSYQAQLSYTLSWAYTIGDGISYNLRDLFYERRSGLDERHRAVLNFSLNLPYGFQLSGIGTIASPTPVAVYVGQDLNDDNNFSDDWIRGEEYLTPTADKIRNWYKMLDIRISKYFEINPVRFGLFLEAYNVGNWYNASSYFPRMRDANGNPYANFGDATGAYLPRTLQLGAKVFFN